MLRTFIFVLALFLIPAPSYANDYSGVIQDLPMMAGMVEIDDSAVSFDTPAGRFLETAAQVKSGQKQVYSFYASTLPGLGWERIDGQYMVYKRGNEMLSIDVTAGATPEYSRVQFRLGPNIPQ